ncbi:MAG: peptidase inactive domain protein [Gemmatimonadetes bacterium]|nr:peptidase inactive domain protein [Gemmatimonadota bacterium]
MTRASLLRLAGYLGIALAVFGSPAAAQDRIVVRTEPGTPVVSQELLLAVGPADEPELQAGIASLTARAVTSPLRATLDSLGAHLEVQVQHDALAFTLTAAPEVWEDASRALLTALFRDPADTAAVARERARIRGELEAAEANPAAVAAAQTDSVLYGAGHPWARPAAGLSATVATLTPADVDVFLRKNFTPDRVTIAVVGPVDPVEAKGFLIGRLNAAALEAPAPPETHPGDGPVRREFGSITAWVTASYRFGRDADVEALRLLALVVADRFEFGPTSRALYDARGEVVRRPGGGEVRFTLVVPPGEVDAWAERLRAAVAAVADAPLPASAFADRVRRFRGERLLALDSPEARARALARELLLSGSRTGEPVPTDRPTAERLQAAAKSLQGPVMVYLGPSVNAGT